MALHGQEKPATHRQAGPDPARDGLGELDRARDRTIPFGPIEGITELVECDTRCRMGHDPHGFPGSLAVVLRCHALDRRHGAGQDLSDLAQADRAQRTMRAEKPQGSGLALVPDVVSIDAEAPAVVLDRQERAFLAALTPALIADLAAAVTCPRGPAPSASCRARATCSPARSRRSG
jgi:hypothetical protein